MEVEMNKVWMKDEKQKAADRVAYIFSSVVLTDPLDLEEGRVNLSRRKLRSAERISGVIFMLL